MQAPRLLQAPHEGVISLCRLRWGWHLELVQTAQLQRRQRCREAHQHLLDLHAQPCGVGCSLELETSGHTCWQ